MKETKSTSTHTSCGGASRRQRLVAVLATSLALAGTNLWAADPVSPDEQIEPVTQKPDPLYIGPLEFNEPSLTEDEIVESLGREQDEDGNWVDDSHHYIGNKTDDLAIYLDRFFGSPLEDLESADSTVRFVTRFQWDEDRGEDIKFRLRGKVDLPRVNERLSLVFNADDSEDRAASDGGTTENTAGFQFKAAEKGRSRFDLTLGIDSGLNLKPGVRYRFKNDLSDWGRFRYTGRVRYTDDDRFNMRHVADFDVLTGQRSIIRWSNKVEYGQRSEGTEWRSSVSWRYGYSLDSAFSVVAGASGETDPEAPDTVGYGTDWPEEPISSGSLVNNYAIVLKLRNKLYKDWLYVEFEPGYTRRKRNHYDERHGVFFGRINFEIIFNRGRERKSEIETETNNNLAFLP
ncbi:MAG: hypothetical protein V7746_05205 [Halioglobus sp.]